MKIFGDWLTTNQSEILCINKQIEVVCYREIIVHYFRCFYVIIYRYTFSHNVTTRKYLGKKEGLFYYLIVCSHFTNETFCFTRSDLVCLN